MKNLTRFFNHSINLKQAPFTILVFFLITVAVQAKSNPNRDKKNTHIEDIPKLTSISYDIIGIPRPNNNPWEEERHFGFYEDSYNHIIEDNLAILSDSDGDTIDNAIDLDDDNDGILDSVELQGSDSSCPSGLFQVISDTGAIPPSRGQLKIFDPIAGGYIDVGSPAGFRYNGMGFHDGLFEKPTK